MQVSTLRSLSCNIGLDFCYNVNIKFSRPWLQNISHYLTGHVLPHTLHFALLFQAGCNCLRISFSYICLRIGFRIIRITLELTLIYPQNLIGITPSLSNTSGKLTFKNIKPSYIGVENIFICAFYLKLMTFLSWRSYILFSRLCLLDQPLYSSWDSWNYFLTFLLKFPFSIYYC